MTHFEGRPGEGLRLQAAEHGSRLPLADADWHAPRGNGGPMTVNESNEPRDEKFIEHEEEPAAEEAAAIGGGLPDYDSDEATKARGGRRGEAEGSRTPSGS